MCKIIYDPKYIDIVITKHKLITLVTKDPEYHLAIYIGYYLNQNPLYYVIKLNLSLNLYW